MATGVTPAKLPAILPGSYKAPAYRLASSTEKVRALTDAMLLTGLSFLIAAFARATMLLPALIVSKIKRAD